MDELPNNPALEKQILGQCLLESKILWPEVLPSDFYHPIHRAIWATMLNLDESNEEIEPLTVYSKLRNGADGSDIGATFIPDLTHGLVHSYRPEKWVVELKNLALRRFLIREFNDQQKNLITSENIFESIEKLEERFDRIRTDFGSKNHGFRSLAEVMDHDVKPALRELSQNKTLKISTGFPCLDKMIGGGFSLADVVLVVSDTGAGKSAFVLQLADNIASQGIGVGFLSGEMQDRENGMRLLSRNATTTNLNSVDHISSMDYQFLVEWADAIKGRPIYFDSHSYDLTTVRSNVKALIKKHGIKVLIIDYIQLYKPNRFSNRMSRSERLTEVSQEVKRMANEFGICVIEVAQFNREGAKSLIPSMHDLEGSGQLEKDTSLIFIIDRQDESQEIKLRIVKGRNSGRCVIHGKYEGRILNFELWNAETQNGQHDLVPDARPVRSYVD